MLRQKLSRAVDEFARRIVKVPTEASAFESRFSLDFDSAQSPRVEFFFLNTSPRARVVELVDTLDLKSNGHCGRAGSSPAPSTE